MMNRFLLFSIVTLFISGTSIAQHSAVTNAILYHKDKDLANAKKEIDLASANEKTKAEPKTWYYKGIIYIDIARSTDPEVKALSIDPLKDAIGSLNNAKQIDASKGEYYKLSDTKLQELWPDIVNRGIADYESEKLKESQEWFEVAQGIKPADTTAYIYASYSAEALTDDAALKKYTDKLFSLNYKSPYVYRNAIHVEKDPAKKLALAQKAVSDFPKDESLIEMLGDLYSKQGKYQDALNQYQNLSTMMPANPTLLLKIALQYEKLHNTDKALENYEKVISLNPANFIAHYNASVIYFERGKDENNKIHQLNVNEYQQKGKPMEDNMEKTFDQALTHANTALQLTKDESDINNIKLMIGEINKVIKK